MIGDNSVPHHIHSADDARAYAAAIARLRDSVESAAAPFDRSLAAFKKDTDAIRAERDKLTAPLAARADSLRDVLAEWLRSDPDGSLKDGDRVVATLARRKPYPVIDPDKVPEKYKSLTVDMAKLNAALINDEEVPGVKWETKVTLRVMT